MTQPLSLRERLMARNGYQLETPEELHIPDLGRIPEEAERRIQELAQSARQGDMAARDTLYEAIRPRLSRIGYMLAPWPNTTTMVGIWDRGDVRQESWIIFTEMLLSWDGESRFVAYLLARFRFRLRDRILRGIGKPKVTLGATRISEEKFADVVAADDSERPESVAMAKAMLEELIRQHMLGDEAAGTLETWSKFVNSTVTEPLMSPDQVWVKEPTKATGKTA